MFSNNLRKYRKQYDISQNDLADKLGYKSFTTIQKWEDGTSIPPYSILLKLASIFKISVDELTSSNRIVPILGTVRGGTPILAEQDVKGYEFIDIDDNYSDEYFYLTVVGDSMINDRILDNDLLYVKKQSYIENGEIGIVLIDDEATVKRIYIEDDKIILKPSNESYKETIISKNDLNKSVLILGKVIHNKIKY